ncbi:MAG: hypothetical protein U1E62_11905 [Alsobacter sp.]
MCITDDVTDQLKSIQASLRLLDQLVQPRSASGKAVSDGLKQNMVRIDRLLHTIAIDSRRPRVMD